MMVTTIESISKKEQRPGSDATHTRAFSHNAKDLTLWLTKIVPQPLIPPLGFQPVIEPVLSALLKAPLGTGHDLFQVLDACEGYTDILIESEDITERMALCGRLLAGLEVLRVVLDEPLPEYLIEYLTAKNSDIEDYDSPLSRFRSAAGILQRPDYRAAESAGIRRATGNHYRPVIRDD